MQVPVIDFGPFLRAEPGALELTATALREASEDLGVMKRGVDQVIINDRAERHQSVGIASFAVENKVDGL